MEDTVSTNPKQEENADSSIKTRLANLLINRVALSECLNVIRDACIQRAAEIVEGADEEQMSKILADLEVFENPLKKMSLKALLGSNSPSQRHKRVLLSFLRLPLLKFKGRP